LFFSRLKSILGYLPKPDLPSPNLCFCNSRHNVVPGSKANIMLHQFTWQQFLIATLIFTLAWYVVVILLFYRHKIAAILSGKSALYQPERLQRDWEEELEDYPEDEELIGKQALPDGVSEVEMHMLGFAPKVHDENEYRDTQLGIVPDVLEELKTIFHILENENGKVEDFISLFSLVKAKYPRVRNTPNEAAINEYIRENLPFEISGEELDSLWV
jgi:hypothetical protein